MKLMKNKKGMTLVELLAVIVILAIITAISVPLIGNLITRTEQGAAASDGNTVFASLRLWAIENPQDVPAVFDFTGDEDERNAALVPLTTAIEEYISVLPDSFEGITFTVTGSTVTVIAAAVSKINDRVVVWDGAGFVRP